MNAMPDAPVPAARMSVDEARRVHWLRNRPMPLGELLDEGYLDTYRLEWAAKKAYDPRIKQAARVVLDWQAAQRQVDAAARIVRTEAKGIAKPAVAVGVSLEDARAVPWPFGPLRGQPMGKLSETRQLSLKDLAFAVESAWDERVKQAAIALLLIRLEQTLQEPAPPRGIMRVVAAGRSYAERRQLSLAFAEGVIGGGVLALALGYLVTSAIGRPGSPRPAFNLTAALASAEGVIGVTLALIFVAGLLWLGLFVPRRLFKKLDGEIEAYRLGNEGEDRVVEKARLALDGDWVLFRNVMLPRRGRSDVDVVLVGPSGVWAIEVKALHGEYRNSGETWEFRSGGRWNQLRKSPSRQARRNAIALAEFLRADGINAYVTAVVAWVSQGSNVAIDNPSVAVWTIDRVEDELANLRNGRRLDATSHERIVDKLTRLCQTRTAGAWQFAGSIRWPSHGPSRGGKGTDRTSAFGSPTGF